jgi:HK97 gp10 family phage protein
MAGVNASMKINQRDLAQLNKKLAYLKGYDRKVLSSQLAFTASHINMRAIKNVKSVANDTGNLSQNIKYEANGKTISVYVNANYAPYVEFGTGNKVDLSDMRELGIPESYAMQFKGEGFTGQKPVYFGKKIGWRMVQFPIHLPARPFFFSAVRVEYKKLLERITKQINTKLK